MLGNEGRLGSVLRIEGRVYRIVGILREREQPHSKTPALTARNLNQTVFVPLGAEPPPVNMREQNGELAEIVVELVGDANVLSAAAVVRRIMKKSHGGIEDFHIVVPQVLLRQAQRTQWVFNVVLGSIAGMLLLVGGVGIMNMMLMNVAERTREIGIRRAVGASRKHIVFQFLFEAILVTVAGGCIGVVMGIGAANAVTAFADWKTVVTAWSILLSIIMAGGVGLLSGLYPAIRAARLDPVEALRYA